MRALREEAERFRETALYFRAAGDCGRVKKPGDAVDLGFQAAVDV